METLWLDLLSNIDNVEEQVREQIDAYDACAEAAPGRHTWQDKERLAFGAIRSTNLAPRVDFMTHKGHLTSAL